LSHQVRLKVVFGVAPYLVSALLCSISSGVCQVKDQPAVAAKSVEAATWPSLSDFHCIKGRAANREDINKGNALFVLEQDGVSIGHAVPLALPQYAYYLNGPGRGKIPCVIIQAEELNGVQILGCRANGSNAEVVDVSVNFQLLGTNSSQSKGR
jgi:hypothetical protein